MGKTNLIEKIVVFRDDLSDTKEDLAFMNRLRGNPPKVGGEDCMSTCGINA